MKEYEELIEIAESLGRDSLFIQILKDEPMHPREVADYDIKEFGLKVKPNGERHNNKWLLDFDFGYVLAYLHKNEKAGRSRGWFEVVFPYVGAKSQPCLACVGMYEEEFEIIKT